MTKKQPKPTFKTVRKEWMINPKTRVKKSGKLYDRQENKKIAKKRKGRD